MLKLSSKMMTHHSVMMSPLHTNNLKNYKFNDFSSDFDFNIKSEGKPLEIASFFMLPCIVKIAILCFHDN